MATDPSVKPEPVLAQSILPVLAALAVQTFQIVERAQVDWAVDCSAPGACTAFGRRLSFKNGLFELPNVLRHLAGPCLIQTDV